MAKFDKNPDYAKQKLENAMTQLEAGVMNLTTSENWQSYLNVQSRFHKYSFGNVMLILAQMPTATRVAGYKSWQKMGRQVMKGQAGITILAPRPYEIETDEIDAKTGKNKVKKGIYFRGISVFDISQTDGKSLTEVVRKLTGEDMSHLLENLVEFSTNGNNCPVTFESYNDASNGYYIPSIHKIVVKSSNSKNQQVKTLIHEIAHSILHKNGEDGTTDKSLRELEAESVAYIVCNALGFDASEYSFGYLAVWARNGGTDFSKAIRQMGEKVQKTAAKILDGINFKPQFETDDEAEVA